SPTRGQNISPSSQHEPPSATKNRNGTSWTSSAPVSPPIEHSQKEEPLTSSTPDTKTRTIPFGRPWLDDADREAVLKVLEGHILTHGPECAGFEQEFGAFMGGPAHCVTMSSCAAALHIA